MNPWNTWKGKLEVSSFLFEKTIVYCPWTKIEKEEQKCIRDN